MTTIYRIKTDRVIAPFGDHVGEIYIADKTLKTWQDEAAAGTGLELVDIESEEQATLRPCFAFYDDIFMSEMALRHFVADATGREVRLAVPDGPVARAVEPLQGTSKLADGSAGYDLVHLVAPETLKREDIDSRFDVVHMTSRGATSDVELPPASLDGSDASRGAGQVTLTAWVVGNVRHWIHVLKIGHLAIGVRLSDAMRASPRRLFKIRRIAKRDNWKAAREMVFVDPTARVHPMADLEACVVGPGAFVDAHAHIRHAVVGAGVQVQDHARVVGSSLAQDVQVLRNSYFAGCMAFPEATISNVKAQLCVFGKKSFLTSSVLMIDARLEGAVRVKAGDEFISVGPFLGSCLGHRVTLGTGVTVEAGRMIPNDLTVVVRSPGYLANTDAPSGARLVTVKDGRLEPLE